MNPSTPGNMSFLFRTSTKGQKDHETIEIQKRMAREFLESQPFKDSGYGLTARYPGSDPTDIDAHFADDGYSLEQWKNDSGVADLLRSIQSGQTQIVWMYNLNRVFRSQSVEIMGKILDCFKNYRIPIWDRTGIKPPDVVMKILAMLGSEEKASTVLRLHDSKMARTMEDGRPPNGKSFYGYRWDKEEKDWFAEKEEEKILRWAGSLSCGIIFEPLPATLKLAFDLHKEGMSDRLIAETLSNAGYSPASYFRRNRYKKWLTANPDGGFKESMVCSWFRENRYCGEYTYRFKRSEDVMHPLAKDKPRDEKQAAKIKLPAIFTTEEWEQLQSQRMKRHHIHRKKRHVVHEYLLADILICSQCGSLMAARPKYRTYERKSDQKTVVTAPTLYYQCARKKLIASRCPKGNYHNAEVIETLVWDAVKSVILNPSHLKAIDRSSKSPISREAMSLREEALGKWITKLAELDHEGKRVTTLLVKEQIDEGEAEVERKRVKLEKFRVNQEIFKLDQELKSFHKQLASAALVDLGKLRKKYSGRLDQLGFEEKRTITRTLLKSVVASPRSEDGAGTVPLDLHFFAVE